jgi:hypothetical protein
MSRRTAACAAIEDGLKSNPSSETIRFGVSISNEITDVRHTKGLALLILLLTAPFLFMVGATFMVVCIWFAWSRGISTGRGTVATAAYVLCTVIIVSRGLQLLHLRGYLADLIDKLSRKLDRDS